MTNDLRPMAQLAAQNIIKAIDGLAQEIRDRALDAFEDAGNDEQALYQIIYASATSVLTDYLLSQFDPMQVDGTLK